MTRFRPALVATAGLLLAAGLAAGSGSADGEDPASLWVGHLRSCLSGVHSLSARFSQDILHPLGGRGAPETGRLELRRGGRLRLEYDAPRGRAVVSDGRLLRSWDPAARLFVEQPAARSLLSRAFAFALEGGGNPDFTVRFLGGSRRPGPGGGRGVIAVDPAGGGESLAERVALVLEPRCPCLRRVVVIESGGLACRLTFEDLSVNPGLGRRRFELSPPPGVEVVRP